MKTTSIKIASGTLVAFCLTLGSSVKAADSTYDIKPRSERAIKVETTTIEQVPADFNKASSIVGMAVRNQMDERLGKIKDVVFDLKSDRVAYAVMRTGGLLQPKLLAVPLSAFTPSANNKYLILRTEKSKLETAIGIERNNWPSVVNPSWGAETFWEKPADDQSGAGAGVSDKIERAPEVTPKPEITPEEKSDAKPSPPETKPETKPEEKPDDK